LLAGVKLWSVFCLIALGDLDSLHGEALLGQSLDPIVKLLVCHWIPSAEAVACRLLGKFGDSTAVRVLQSLATRNEDAKVRAVAAQALAQIAARCSMAPSTERKQPSGRD
jgi:HEAT repeat protein